MSFKLNPFTGNFDLAKEDNFSYDVIDTLEIPTGQQMIVYGTFRIDDTLIINGDLILL